MKTRTGFVSNSSSSSFIVYGYAVEDGKNDLIMAMIKADPAKVWTDYINAQSGFVDELQAAAADDDLAPYTAENFFDDEHIDFVLDMAGDWEIFEELSINGYEYHSDHEGDNGGVVGVYLGSCDYGVTAISYDVDAVITKHKDALKAISNGKKIGLYSIYTGY